MKMHRFHRSLAQAALLALLGAPLASNAVVLATATSSFGNQATPLAEGAGLQFHVNSPITVTQLGIFDSGADGIGGSTPLWTSLFSFDKFGQHPPTLLATTDFSPASPGTLSDFFRFKTITPVTLAVGDYALIGYEWNAANLEWNGVLGGKNSTAFNDGGGLVTYSFSLYGTVDHTRVPTARFAANTFNGPNMVFQAAAAPVPEPASVALMAAGLLAIGARRLRR